MRKIIIEDETKIQTNYSKFDMNRLQKGSLNTSDIDSYMAFLQKRDDQKCEQNIKEKLLLFYNVNFIKFNKNYEPHYIESEQMIAKHKDIFQLKHIFISILY
jgi:hypothetical protein